MTKVRVHNLAMSLDGYVAGPDQGPENPMGVGGMALHQWVFATPTGAAMVGEVGGTAGLDDDFLKRGDEGIGATIMGRNMFGPVRGPWPDASWRGWWGEEPPYHHDVFVLTHHERPQLAMEGGTTFHFVTDGIRSALDQATEAAAGQDIRLGGGASTIQQFLREGLVDELHLALVPVLLGGGERLFDHLGEAPVGYEVVEVVPSPAVVHVRLAR
jgi:dihydrofolate reductase